MYPLENKDIQTTNKETSLKTVYEKTHGTVINVM